MSQEYTARTFKSGNSVALRLPKGLGIKEDVVMKVREEHGSFIVEPVEKPKRKFNIAKVWGCAAGSGMQPIRPEDRVFEHRPLLWDDGEEHVGPGGLE
jgi:antitoxin VapB